MEQTSAILEEMLSNADVNIVRIGERFNVTHDRDQEFLHKVIDKNELLVTRVKACKATIKKQDKRIKALENEIKRLKRRLYGKGADDPPKDTQPENAEADDLDVPENPPEIDEDAQTLESPSDKKRKSKGKSKKNYGKNAIRRDRFSTPKTAYAHVAVAVRS